MKIIVTGATGMVGMEVIRQAILDENIESITAISRTPIELRNSKLINIIHHDYTNFEALENLFKKNDTLIWCLGISQSQVSQKKYEEITYDYTVAAANAMLHFNPQCKFIFLSGAGADNSEKSRTLFARIKGKAENYLMGMSKINLTIVRPAGIKPIHKNPNTPFLYELFNPLFPIFELITPNYFIPSDILAKAILRIAKHGADKTIIHNIELKQIGNSK